MRTSLRFRRAFALLLGLLSFGPALAKSLYISTTGNDAVTYAGNSISTPWKSVSNAFLNTQPGDTVFIMAGQYDIKTKINQAHLGVHGTAAKPIVITAYGRDSVLITGNDSLDGVIEIEKDWYTVQNLNFRGPGKFFRTGYDYTGDHFTLRNCKCVMTIGGDNYGFVYVDGSTGVTIDHCNISGIYPSGDAKTTKSCSIIAFHSPGLRVLNCELHHAMMGVYYKHANDPGTGGIEIAYNYIHHTDMSAMELNCNHARIHDNLFGLVNAPFKFNDANGRPGGDSNFVDHNTLYDNDLVLNYATEAGDPLPGAVGNVITNNLIMHRGEYHTYSAVPHASQLGYNMYSPISQIFENRVSYTLPTWQAHSKQDKGSLVGVPIFASVNPTEILHWQLTALSPGYRKGSDGRDVGADIRAVGPNPAGPINLPPNYYRSVTK